MALLNRLLTLLSVALLAVGAVGAGTHGSWARARPPRAAGAPSSTSTSIPAASSVSPTTGGAPTTAPGPAPGTAALEAGLVTPTDMGGYYRVDPSVAAATLDSAPCLAALQPSPAQAGRAVSALLGPDYHSVPTVVEVVASYAGGRSRAVYDAVARSVNGCPAFRFTFGGTAVSSDLRPSALPQVGDADQAWSGSFGLGGVTLTFQMALVLDGPDVLTVIWIDSVPPADAVMGNFPSTVSLAIGKLA